MIHQSSTICGIQSATSIGVKNSLQKVSSPSNGVPEYANKKLFSFMISYATSQHFFNCALENKVDCVATEQCFGLEFEDVGIYRFMIVSNLEGNNLCRVLICRSGLPSTDLKEDFERLARLLSVASTKADLVACSGSPTDFIWTVDHSEYSIIGVQS